MTFEPLVEHTRGSLAEIVHAGAIAVVDHHGQVLAHAGDAHAMCFTRSTLKPFQALPLQAVVPGQADPLARTAVEAGATNGSNRPGPTANVEWLLTETTVFLDEVQVEALDLFFLASHL